MPWIKIFVSVSALGIVFGDAGRVINTPFRYVTAIIPIAGLLVIYGTAFNNEEYPISKQLLFLLPSMTLILIVLVIGIKISDSGGRMRESNFESLAKEFEIGFWLTLIASSILPNLNCKK